MLLCGEFFWWGFCSSCKAPSLAMTELGKRGKTWFDFSQKKNKTKSRKHKDLQWFALVSPSGCTGAAELPAFGGEKHFRSTNILCL